jgi:hypothetical protein
MIALIIFSVILGLSSIACFIYSILAFREIGPILTNEYLLATMEERRKLMKQSPLKKKRDYRTTANIYFILSLILIATFIYVLLELFAINAFFMMFIIASFVIILLIYVITSSIKDGEFR